MSWETGVHASLLNTQHCKVWIKGKLNNPRKGVAPTPMPWLVAIEKGAFRLHSSTVNQQLTN